MCANFGLTVSCISCARKIAQSLVAQLRTYNHSVGEIALDENVPEVRIVRCRKDLDLIKDVSGVPSFTSSYGMCPLIRVAWIAIRL